MPEKFKETGELTFVRTDRNGTQYFTKKVRCWRCNGYGTYYMGVHNGELIPSSVANGVCFRCGGTGWELETVKEYTPEYAAKLAARRAKKAAAEAEKRAAEQAERDAYYARVREEAAKREAERLAEIERNRGQFIGKVGDKIQMEVTFVRSFEYTVSFGWSHTNMTGYVFKTDDGNTLVWKTSGSGLMYETVLPPDAVNYCGTDENGNKYDIVSPDEGERITIKATIKDHQEYRDVNQTILNRVKWIH